MASEHLLTDEQIDAAAQELCRIRGLPLTVSILFSARGEISRLQQVYQAIQRVLQNGKQ